MATLQLSKSGVRPAAVSRRTAVQTNALFAGLKSSGGTKTIKEAMVCLDCGYIYDGKKGAFAELPGTYACPVCGSGKKRFRQFEGNVSRSNDNKTMVARRDALREQLEARGEKIDDDLSFLLVTAASAAVFLGAVYYFTSVAR